MHNRWRTYSTFPSSSEMGVAVWKSTLENRLSVRVQCTSAMHALQLGTVSVEKPTQQEYNDGLTRRQFVFEFDQETWKVSCILSPLFRF